MAQRLGVGGRNRALNARNGKAVAAVPLYAAVYFATNASNVRNPMSGTSTLATLAPWEVQVPGTNGYARKRIDELIANAADTGLGYSQAANAAAIEFFTRTGALAQAIGTGKPISHMVITTQATSQSSTSLADIVSYGPLMQLVTALPVGEALRIPASEFVTRQA